MKVRIGDLTKIRTGKLDANVSSENGKYPFFTCSKEPLKISTYSYDCECVLVAGNGDLNVKYYNGKFDAYQRTYIIEDNGSHKIYVPYLYYFMERYIEELRKQAIGGVIKYIKLGNLTEAVIELPSIEDQKAIVRILEKSRKILNLRHNELVVLDKLIKARFVELFGDPVHNPYGWNKTELKELADLKIGPFGSLLHKEDYIEGGHALVNPSHIVDGRIIIDSKLTVSEDKYEELSAYHLKVGDVVMGRRGEMGRCAVVEEEGLLCGTGSLLIRPKGKVTADYIQKIISYPTFKKTIEDMAVGQTMSNLNVPIVSGFRIIAPPIEVQNSYYDFVAQVNKSKVVYQIIINKLTFLQKICYNNYKEQYHIPG